MERDKKTRRLREVGVREGYVSHVLSCCSLIVVIILKWCFDLSIYFLHMKHLIASVNKPC